MYPTFPDSEDEKQHLERTGREWAIKVYTAMVSIHRISSKVILKVTGQQVTMDTEDHSQIQNVIKKITEETIRWKTLLRNASEGWVKLCLSH